MQEELKTLQKSLGITFIFVTHDQGEALSMADRVAVFSEGKVMQVGAPEEIYARPISRFVADFVGSSNVLPPDFVAPFAGEARWASLRPEAITLVASGDPKLTGTVVSRNYLGSTTRIGIALGALTLHAIIPSGQPVPNVGEGVSISFAREALHLMEPEK